MGGRERAGRKRDRDRAVVVRECVWHLMACGFRTFPEGDCARGEEIRQIMEGQRKWLAAAARPGARGRARGKGGGDAAKRARSSRTPRNIFFIL